MRRLEGKSAIVTGAGNGIGAATARRLAREGAAVVVADINASAAAEVAQTIRQEGGNAFAHCVDIGSEAAIETLIGATLARFGKIDVLHNNAADNRLEEAARDMAMVSQDRDVWDHQFHVNTRGTMLMIKHALPALLRTANGSIINTSSGGSLLGDLYRPAYAASKAAVNSLTRYVAAQYGKRGIRCNAVLPGLILTAAVATNIPRERLQLFERHTLTPYLGQPEDIAAMVALLASDDGRFITGQAITVDGGISSHFPYLADLYEEFSAG
jgi:NAD(P)-dependent dehydrogenase (short-subunit alcohol dehydrogenase family)